MKDTRFNVRIESKLAAQVKAYAKRHRTTVSAMVVRQLRELLAQERQSMPVIQTGEAEQV
jgi:hypothetical protein